MKTIEIQILAEDIIQNGYFDHRNCPITLALKRAGINAEDKGTEIRHISGDSIIRNYQLSLKVRKMCRFAHPDQHSNNGDILKPQDFKYSLEIPENW